MDRLAAIADPKLKDTLLYVRGQPDAVAADDVAAALGIHRNAARGRLERLARAGALRIEFERRTGRTGPGAGRPAKLYRVAPETEPLEVPPRRLASLLARLVDEVPSRTRPEALRRVGRDFGRELADASGLRPSTSLRTGLERVCEAVRSLGFQASLARVDGDAAVIATPTCPLRPLVVERSEVAELDRGMWAGLVERGVKGVRAEDVSCETCSCLDPEASCEVVLRLEPRS
ncbi:MAG TPA: hypothetical protein VH306_02850 [Gaiellaceae bacterium]|jgi:predicted ArsR family transcriptional regulator